MSLSQGCQDAVEYALRFCTLAEESQWNEPALKAEFRKGLNKNILTELACRDDEAMLDSLIDMSIWIYDLLRDRRSTPSHFPVSEHTTAELMLLGNARVSPQEQTRRRDAGLCFY